MWKTIPNETCQSAGTSRFETVLVLVLWIQKVIFEKMQLGNLCFSCLLTLGENLAQTAGHRLVLWGI